MYLYIIYYIYYIYYILYYILYIIYYILYTIYYILYIIIYHNIIYIYIQILGNVTIHEGKTRASQEDTLCLVIRGWEVHFLRCCQESCWHVAVCLAAQQWMSGWEEHGTPGTGCPKAEPCTRRSIFGHCGIAWTWFPLVPCRDGPIVSVDAGWWCWGCVRLGVQGWNLHELTIPGPPQSGTEKQIQTIFWYIKILNEVIFFRTLYPQDSACKRKGQI